VGKVTLDDVPILYQHYLEGTIAGPQHIPAMFRNMNGLYVWFGFASGISVVNSIRVQKHFDLMFRKMPKSDPLYDTQQQPMHQPQHRAAQDAARSAENRLFEDLT
jgi:hypothetical protein